MPTRRDVFKQAAALAGAGVMGGGMNAASVHSESSRSADVRYRIGACDWSLDLVGDPQSLARARKIGLDGVQVSLRPDQSGDLRQKKVQQAYRRASERYGVALGGLAIARLNGVPYKSDPRTRQWVRDSIDVARALDVKNVLLAFFADNDLKDDAEGQQEVIERLRAVAPKAEEAGVVLGLETTLSAEEHLDIIRAVGSENVKVYYDVANSFHNGYDIYEEIRRLGTEYICEIHAKEQGHLLGEGPVNFERVRAAIEDIGYRGWLQVEGAVPEGADLIESYIANAAFLRSVFFGSKRGAQQPEQK